MTNETTWPESPDARAKRKAARRWAGGYAPCNSLRGRSPVCPGCDHCLNPEPMGMTRRWDRDV